VFGGALLGRELYVESHGGEEFHPADPDAPTNTSDTPED